MIIFRGGEPCTLPHHNQTPPQPNADPFHLNCFLLPSKKKISPPTLVLYSCKQCTYPLLHFILLPTTPDFDVFHPPFTISTHMISMHTGSILKFLEFLVCLACQPRHDQELCPGTFHGTNPGHLFDCAAYLLFLAISVVLQLLHTLSKAEANSLSWHWSRIGCFGVVSYNHPSARPP